MNHQGTRDTISNSRNIKNAMDRLTDLERATTMIMGLVDREIGTLVTQVNALSEVINALTEVVGLDQVQALLTKKAEEKRDTEAAQIADAVASGKIVVAEKISEHSVVSYEERDGNGTLRIPGKFFKNVSTLSAEAKNMLLGQLVGFEAGIGNGATMKVLEIWDMAQAAASLEAAPVLDATAPVANSDAVSE